MIDPDADDAVIREEQEVEREANDGDWNALDPDDGV